MSDPLGRRPSLAPRSPRVLHQGPGTRYLELALVLHVVLIFLALLLGWLLAIQRGLWLMPLLVALGAIAVFCLDWLRFKSLRRLRMIAHDGHILSGIIKGSGFTRFSRALRVDRALPRTGVPFVRGLEVRYEFETPAGVRGEGRFLATAKDLDVWVAGRPIEVFYLEEDPAQNVPSLVLRWYYRLGASTYSDEPPTGEFEEPVEIEWWE